MELSKQVTSLEISKRLQELGVKQESYFSYREDNGSIVHRDNIEQTQEYQIGFYTSAFTVAELGEMLPDGYGSWLEKDKWVCKEVGVMNVYSGCDDTEADARGKMLVYLLENNLLSPQGN